MDHERAHDPDGEVLGKSSSPEVPSGLTRRRVLGRALGGAAVFGGGALLAACGSSSSKSSSSAATSAASSSTPAATGGSGTASAGTTPAAVADQLRSILATPTGKAAGRG